MFSGVYIAVPSNNIFLPQALYAVTGWPLSQSLSPLIHNTGFQTLGIPAVYLAFPVAPRDLPHFVHTVRMLHMGGVSVTIPHKEAVIPLLDGITERARSVGAVNTLFWKDMELWGDNTDIAGFLAPLEQMHMDFAAQTALVLGAGGAARAVVGGLAIRGCRHIHISTPSNKSHLPLAAQFGATPVNWEDHHSVQANLVINTTPLGMHGSHENESPWDFSATPLAAGAIAYDIVYNPLTTRFLREAREHGHTCVTGREMFFAQGNAQFKLWTRMDLPDVSRVALDQTLDGALDGPPDTL